MANDTDMWNDVKELEKGTDKDREMGKDLMYCFIERFVDGNERRANKLKKKFEKKWKMWGNYY